MKKIIDLTDGAKILGSNRVDAQKMLEYLVDMFPKAREELNNAYDEYQSSHGVIQFGFVVEKFYEGLLYVGAPALRQSVDDFLTALRENKQRMIDPLYQCVLGDMDALEQKISETKKMDNTQR